MTASESTAALVPLAASADRALRQLASLSKAPALQSLRGPALLMERATHTHLHAQHGRSFSGHCRFLAAADGSLALNLARDDDWQLLPAWLEVDNDRAWSWSAVATEVARRRAVDLLDRARTLGIAAAMPNGAALPASGFCSVSGAALRDGANTRNDATRPLVVDLSALWAGPLCGHLLRLAGADVIKVESLHRPDGARSGNATFYGLLNQGKQCVALNLANHRAQQTLCDLLLHADIVIEASRPRGLQQMQIHADELLAQKPSLTWISITGYGRAEPYANWIAFGDDAGVAAGLSEVMRQATGSYQFAGDAIADPLTGIHAALVAWRSWQAGGSRLISLALTDVAAASLADERARCGEQALLQSFRDWWRYASASHRMTATRAQGWVEPLRQIAEPVGLLGEHTGQVLRRLQLTC